MPQTTIEKFRIIGASTKMQRMSLGEEFELIAGIPYDIDFDQDFSAVELNGQLITDMPAASIFEFLNNSKNKPQIFRCNTPIYDARESNMTAQELKEAIEDNRKEEEKAERKWKKNRKKRKKHTKKLLQWLEDFKNF